MKKTLLILLIATTGCAMSFERLVNRTEDKVVKVGIVTDDGRRGSGSGVFIDSRGTVLTCAHVVGDARKIFVKTTDGTYLPGYIKHLDAKKDLALVRTDFVDTPFVLISKGDVEVGQVVAAFGSPLGIQRTASFGHVMNRMDKSFRFIHSAFILPGSSGGPLVDVKGRLVGINEAIVMMNIFVPAAGYCIAIDGATIRAFLGTK